MINLTMIARNRHELTEQALASLALNTPKGLYSMTFLDDGSDPRFIFPAGVEGIGHTNEASCGGAGPARNQVIRLSESHFGRGEMLYLSDNDALFQPRWLEALLEAWSFAKSVGFKAISGYAHPYNRAAIASWPIYLSSVGRSARLVQTHAIATQSWLMEWETWDAYGPFAEAQGVRQSEDVRMSQQIQSDGFKVGFIEPFVVLNTALTDTYGVEVPGAELLERHEGVVML